jgi:hypothetical protein
LQTIVLISCFDLLKFDLLAASLRCLDPSDCGTFASAIRCPRCKLSGGGSDPGYLMPAGKLGASSKEWDCSVCKWKTEKSYVEKVIEYGLSYIR